MLPLVGGTYSVRNTSTETKKLTSVEFSTSSSGGFTLSSFTVSPYSSSSEDVIAAIEKQTGELDQSITDAGQGVQDKIESQFDRLSDVLFEKLGAFGRYPRGTGYGPRTF